MKALCLRLLATLAALVGVLDVLAGWLASPDDWLDRLAEGLAGQPMDPLQSVVLGIGLLVLAWGLAAGRRAAWWVALVGVGLTLLTAITAGPVPVAAAGGALVALVLLRDAFGTPANPRRLRQAAHFGAATFGLVLVITGWELIIEGERPGAVGAVMLAGLTSAAPPPAAHATVLTLVIGTGLITLLTLILAPAPAPAPGSPQDRDRVRLLAGYPEADSLAPFASRADKSYLFSPDGRAAIGYRVLLGTALAGGDPVGDRASAGAAVGEFLAHCAHHGWRPAVLGAGNASLPLWRAAGLRGLVIGDEAVLDLNSFALHSRRMRNLRQAVARSRNAGVTVTVGPLDAALATELRPVLTAWLAGRRLRGFAMNLDQILVPRTDCVYAVARAGTGQAVAFARFASCAGGRILTLDVAPRRPDAPGGVVERLIVAAVEHARATGAAEVSLNFAGLRRVLEAPGVLAAAARVPLHAFDRWIELGPLYRFATKFHPRWQPRSLLLASWPQLPVVAAAAITAELGAVSAQGEPEPVAVTGASPDLGRTLPADDPAGWSTPVPQRPHR